MVEGKERMKAGLRRACFFVAPETTNEAQITASGTIQRPSRDSLYGPVSVNHLEVYETHLPRGRLVCCFYLSYSTLVWATECHFPWANKPSSGTAYGKITLMVAVFQESIFAVIRYKSSHLALSEHLPSDPRVTPKEQSPSYMYLHM